jgi:hypothetical protein
VKLGGKASAAWGFAIPHPNYNTSGLGCIQLDGPLAQVVGAA